MSFDKTSDYPSVQYQPSPRVTPKETPVESPKNVGIYSSGAPKDNGMTSGEPTAGAKIY
jgi:hypothetical protein